MDAYRPIYKDYSLLFIWTISIFRPSAPHQREMRSFLPGKGTGVSCSGINQV